MSNPKIFNSKTKPVPQIRPDLNIIPVQNNGDSYLYFQDIRGYVTPDFALDYSARNVLSLLDGHKSINDLKPYFGNGVNAEQLLQYVQFLDDNQLLYSPHFKSYAEQRELEYEQSSVHQSVTAGGSYPDDPHELQAYLDEAFTEYGQSEPVFSTKLDNHIEKSSTSFVVPPHCAQTDVILSSAERSRNMPNDIKALYAPHIDPRVGMKTYVESFQLLKEIKPKRVVMLATSHYAGMYADLYQNSPFIVSNKDFQMPMGTVTSDREAINRLMKNADTIGLSSHDRAHRIEHSIELHLLFLQYIWDHEFSIVPILVGGFDELFYAENSHLSGQIETFSEHLRSQFGGDKATLFLISGDLAHVGKKFGDDRPAAVMENEVARFDEEFLEAGENNSTDQILRLMKHNYDPYRICGFPPLYTFLKAFPDLKGETVSYGRWDEAERESAVTFGSILYQ